jgi:hypothetical protein
MEVVDHQVRFARCLCQGIKQGCREIEFVRRIFGSDHLRRRHGHAGTTQPRTAQNFGNVPSPAASVTHSTRAGLLQVVMPLRHQGRLAEARASGQQEEFSVTCRMQLANQTLADRRAAAQTWRTIFGKIREGRLIAS